MNERVKPFQDSGLYSPWARRGRLVCGLALLGATASCGPEQVDYEEPAVLREGLTTTVSFQNGTGGYTGAADTYLQQSAPTTNYAAATTCRADGDDGGGNDVSCLLRWNLSTVPTSATVTSVTLTLNAVNASTNTYNIYEVKRSWNAPEATWQKATAAVSWATAGALGTSDRGAVVGTVTGSGSRVITLNAAGRTLVQNWIRNPTSNAGLIVASSSNSDGIDFASSEYATVAARPKLSITYNGGGSTGTTPTEPNLLVAFLGDQGNSATADAVLKLIKAEGAAAAVHNGDFDYVDNPTIWNNRINNILGPDYPYFAVVGNHDAAAWDGAAGYQSFIKARHTRVPAMNCTGDLGVKATCKFRGLFFAQTCVGTGELTTHGNCSKDSPEQVSFLQSSLDADDSIWSVCLWHKNQNDMQVGSKTDEVGWNAYRTCMNGGAIVATGHEHSYARTQTLTDLGNRLGNHGRTGQFDVLNLALGQTFVFVSGLGGNSVRDYEAATHDDDTWWASYYASNKWLKNNVVQTGAATHGALFVRFYVDGNPRKARAYFKDVNGRIADEFTIFAN